ncbi:MAG: 50S ribosomal protein L4 [Candidatus Yonathbacteria bacterium RIFOXYC1_FULL_52_10]|uniref:Large ribosomal subunit protein uL4 n=1 Tax=Candidatus Yonathbacteria bacterium RIFOXYD1_FULL_52_36 TaxID=1802730 RepID=A0A1G2SJM5_9BACT|nr:MAG: 50S ribosomal protein L4 [Candidatus Yonathbacteria bacterium RIFOXYD1_FULL_52_36]OHA85558.1 MAG: 50S ribosomal protein L4 [Candidatus Yonathbacteria bacterium RIFOXYC1_FULL_52_10]
MEATVYSQKGKESGKMNLPEEVFGLNWNADLVHQVVEAIRSNMRTPVAHTKDRSDVAGGGKKPWRQKGTGRARHGSIRSPLWRGGGVAHGPRNEKAYTKKVNKKMRAKALYTVLSEKFRSGHVLFVDALDFSAPKTKDAKGVVGALSTVKGFEKLSTKKTNTALIALPGRNISAEKSFRNFSNMEVLQAKDLNPYIVMNHKYLVIAGPEESVKTIASRMTKNA